MFVTGQDDPNSVSNVQEEDERHRQLDQSVVEAANVELGPTRDPPINRLGPRVQHDVVNAAQ